MKSLKDILNESLVSGPVNENIAQDFEKIKGILDKAYKACTMNSKFKKICDEIVGSGEGLGSSDYSDILDAVTAGIDALGSTIRSYQDYPEDYDWKSLKDMWKECGEMAEIIRNLGTEAEDTWIEEVGNNFGEWMEQLSGMKNVAKLFEK